MNHAYPVGVLGANRIGMGRPRAAGTLAWAGAQQRGVPEACCGQEAAEGAG